MTTIRRTFTLFEYDGPQLFEGRGDDRSQYLALLVGSEERGDLRTLTCPYLTPSVPSVHRLIPPKSASI